MTDHTQEEQRAKWLDLAERAIDTINTIDLLTPATPTMEPDWWVHMMDIRRKLYDAIAATAPPTSDGDAADTGE